MKTLLFTLILLVSSSLAQARPNFVFIIADDLTHRDLGCYGGQAHTPNIDFLATQGMRFERCFQATAMCSPTRHNIYTGIYPVKSGAYPNHTFAKDGTKSIVHYLKDLDYRVALSGKSHVAPEEVFPFEYSAKERNPDLEAIERLMSDSVANETPFCLFACSTEPHLPWTKGDPALYPPEKVILPPYIVDTPVVRENFSRYLAEITYYDNQVGQILALLDEYGLSENTMVMVVSEQGNAMPFAKWTCYGNGLQSAMIVRWPGKVVANSTTDAMVEYCDIVPTFVSAAGGKPAKVLDGKSFLPVLVGKASRHKEYVFAQATTRGINNGSDNFPIRTIRDERYRLVWNLNPTAEYMNNATTMDFFQSMEAAAGSGDAYAIEYVNRYKFRPELELFDCSTDPLEMNNLAQNPEYEKTIKRLKTKLVGWMADQGDLGIPTEKDAIYRSAKTMGKTKEEIDKAWAKRLSK